MTAWLRSSTFYGQWLPGDPRGSVTNVRDRRPCDPAAPGRIEHERPGEDYEDAIPGVQQAALAQRKGPPVAVALPEAEQLLDQFQETAAYRRWTLRAVSVMFNHLHLVVEASPVVGKTDLLRDFKSDASRRLNRLFGARASGTWWTDSGSCRPVRHLPAAVYYVCHRQPNPLVVWSCKRGRIPPAESHPGNVYSEAFECKPPKASEPSDPSEPPASAGGVGKIKRAAICIEPEHGTVGALLINEAAKEAVKGVGFDVLFVCGFAFDPAVSEEAKRYGKLVVPPTKMNPDLAMGDELLKKTGAGNLFMVFGEPDIEIRTQTDGRIGIEIKGLDVYDPASGNDLSLVIPCSVLRTKKIVSTSHPQCDDEHVGRHG